MTEFESMFKHKYPNYEFLLKYMKAAIGKEEINYCDLTAVNLSDFVEYLKESVSPNTAATYCTILKAFLNFIEEEVELPTRRFALILKVKRVPQQNIALNEDEVEKIDKYYQMMLKKKGHQVTKDVLNNFLLECYCGGRGSDINNLTPANIHNGMLTYVSQKTNVLATIPEHYRLKDLFRRKSKRQYQRSSINRVLKRVCRECGITDKVKIFYRGSMVYKEKCELVGMHTARRSFASMLAAKGVPIPEISQYMGHTQISMTEKYVKVDSMKVSDAALTFFNK